MTATLLPLLQGLILLTLCADLWGDFTLLPDWSRVVLLIAAGAAAGGLLRLPPQRARSLARLPFALVGGAAMLLAAAGVVNAWLGGRLVAGWEPRAEERLERRAALLVEDVGWLLAELSRPLGDSTLLTGDRSDRFLALQNALRRSALPPQRLGLSIHSNDGTLAAWAGDSADVPGDILAAPEGQVLYRVSGGDHAMRLFASSRAPDGSVVVSQLLLRPPSAAAADSDPQLDILPHWRAIAPAHVHLREGRSQDDDLALFFNRQGDRHWSRLGRDGPAILSFPLRSPDGASLAVVSLTDLRVSEVALGRQRLIRLVAALLLFAALLAATLMALPGREPAPRPRDFLPASIGLWSSRTALLLASPATSLPPLYGLQDVTLYSSAALGGLLRSPLDLLLTAATALVQAWLLRDCLIAIDAPPADPLRKRLRVGALAAAIALLLVPLLVQSRLLDRLVLDTRLDLSRVALDAHLPARTAMQASLFLLAAAYAITLFAAIDLALRLRRQAGDAPPAGLRVLLPGSMPVVLRRAAAVLLLTLLYVPALHLAYDRMHRRFFEEDLLPRMVHQKERRERILLDALALAGTPEFAAAASFAAEHVDRGAAVAYRLWNMTPMADMGLASSLQIYDRHGPLLGRFAVNLAPMQEVAFATARDAAGAPPSTSLPGPQVTVRKPVLFASRWVTAPRRPPLLVVISVVDHYDNLPLLGAETTYRMLFRARGLTRTNPELVRFDPLIAVFGAGLERLYESGGEIPAPGTRELLALEAGHPCWTSEDIGEGSARVLYARGPAATIVALAAPHLPTLGLVASCLRMFLLNVALAALLLAGLHAGARILRARTPTPPPGRTFYRRLMTVFLLSALLPLLALAFFITRFSAREFARDVTQSGLGALQVARRVAEDYLNVSAPDEDPSLDDDVVFWLSRVVRQDLSIFRGADLQATSTRELYGSGLLEARLDGAVYRALYLEREPFLQAEEHAGDLEYLTLSAPMRIDRDGTIGVLSIPLAAQSRAIARKVEEVEDAILISTCVTVLLLAGVGWVVARRVSEPIVLLARASRRVADGALETRVQARARDEVAVLVDAFNRMAASLQHQRDDLRRGKDYIEKILRGATTGVVSIDAAGSVITINPAAQDLLAGSAGAPQAGDRLAERLGRDPALRPMRAELLSALEGAGEREAEMVLTRGEAERRLRAVFIPFSPDESGPPGRIILLEDVTEIIRSGRLAAWADMARRIAHEIKNPLTPIQLSIDHLRRLRRAADGRFDAALDECLDNIGAQVRVLRHIASEFSAYARLPHLRLEDLSLDDLLAEILRPYVAAAPPGLSIERSMPPDLPPIRADRAVLGRVLVNLIENALQAMPDGGTLRILAAVEDASASPPWLRLEIRDTGTGIDPALLPRLFEPYFSTRSGGTGLGLAIVRRAVEEHGGTIEIHSRPGEGTLVTLRLPAAGPPIPGPAAV